MNSLTTGQLQRKVQYAVSQLKPTDERIYSQYNSTTVDQSSSNERENNECSGRMDMVVTVRQIDQPETQPTETLAEQSWKPYIDRLFEQGHSPKDIRRSLQAAAKPTLQDDNPYLKDVFNYIDEKTNQQRAKTAPLRRSSVEIGENTQSIARQHVQSTNLFQTIKSNEGIQMTGAIMKRSSSSISVCALIEIICNEKLYCIIGKENKSDRITI